MRHNYFNLNQNASKNDGQVPRNVQMSRYCPQPDSVSNPCRCRDLATHRVFSAVSSARAWKYVAMIFAVLVMSMANVGMAWAVDFEAYSAAADRAAGMSSPASRVFRVDGSTYTEEKVNSTAVFSTNLGASSSFYYYPASGGNAAYFSTGSASGRVFAVFKQSKNADKTLTWSNSDYTITSVTIVGWAASGKNAKITVSNGTSSVSRQFSGGTVVSQKLTSDPEVWDITTLTFTNGNTKGIRINFANKDESGNDCGDFYFYIKMSGTVGAGCTAPNHVDVTATRDHYTPGQTMSFTATAYSSAGTGSPITSNITYQWQKYNGSSWVNVTNGTSEGTTISGATTTNLQIANCVVANGGSYRCTATVGGSCATSSAGYHVRVWTFNGNYSGSGFVANNITWTSATEGTIAVTLNANSTYEFKVYDNDGKYFGCNSGISQDASNWTFRTSDGNCSLSTGKVAGTYTFAINVANVGDNTITLSVTYPNMTIYMSGGSTTWCSADPVFFAHAYKGGTSTDVKMTKHSCEDIYYADVPSYNTNVAFTRQAPGSESIAWYGDANFWNKSDEITIGSNNKFTCTGWNTTPEPDQGSFSGSVYSPTTYTVSAAASTAGYGTVSAASVTGVACGTSISATTNTLSVGATNVTATPASATAEYTYAFDNWTWTPAGSTVTSDVTATANFTRTPKSYTLTWVTDGDALTGTYTSGSVAYGTTITKPDTPTKTGYTFAGWSSTPASTMPAANTTYTATWTAKTTTITINANTSNHGSTALSPITATYGSALPSFTAAAGESGYSLTGYFTEATSGTKIINADGTLVASTDYADGSGNWKYETSTLTLYPQYEEEGGGDCTPINASITFDNNKSAKYNTAWEASDITTSGGAAFAQVGVGTDTHKNSKMALKLDSDGDSLKLTIPDGITSGNITIKACTYDGRSGFIKIRKNGTELSSTEVGLVGETKTYKITNEDAEEWSEPILKTVSYDITSGGVYSIKRTTNSVYIYAFSATGTKVCDDEPAGEAPIPALISYYLQTPNKSTTPASLSTDSIVTTPARLKGDTLKNFVPMTLGSSLDITKAGKGDGGTWSAGIGTTPTDSATAVTDAYAAKLAFDVHDDYELNISSITLKVLSVTNSSQIYRVKVSDGEHTVYGRVAPGKDTESSVVFGSFSGIKFSGTVTLTLWVWSTAAAEYRLKSPIQIDGTLTRKATACTMPTQTFTADAYTLGDDALDLSTLFTSNSDGAVTYSVVNAGGTSAAIVGSSFTASNTGTATIRATQAADTEGGHNYCAKSIETTITVSGDCTPQSLSKVSATKGTSGTVTGYNDGQYAGDAVVNLYSKSPQSASLSGVGTVDGYKMGDDGTSIVFATLKGTSFQAGDKVKIGITKKSDNRTVDASTDILTIYYGTSKTDVAALHTITGVTGAGFYEYTLTSADETAIGSKKGIGLFRESSNGENPYVYSVEIIGCREWAVCTAPNAVVASGATHNSAVLTVTDAAETGSYEFYWNTTGTAPTASTAATATGSSLTKTITGLSANTTYYYWVRSNCGGVTKSAWVAGTPATFATTEAPATAGVTYNDNGSTGGDVPTDDTDYEEGDVVTVKGNTGSLVKTGYSFVGWNTASDGTGTFYPAGYKFYMPNEDVTLYAVWGSVGSRTVNIAYFETSLHNYNSTTKKPDAAGKYLYGYTNSAKTGAYAYTLTTSSTNNVGQGTGASDYLRMDYGTTVTIYADSATKTTPAGFTGVTAVSVDFKMKNSSYSTTFDIYVGSTKIADNVSLAGDAQTAFKTYTYSGLSNLDGVVKIVNKGSGSSNFHFYVDNISISYGSGASSGYTVSFNMKDHGSAIADIENIPSGSKIGAPLPEPTATDWDFGGWYKETGCTNAWNFESDQVTSNTTLYAKWSNCAPTITTHPVSANYNQNGVAAALTVAANDNGGGTLLYQWWVKENDLADEDGSVIPGETGTSFTPSTELLGTSYYYCVVSNDCGNVKTNTAAVTIRDAKPDPKAIWDVDEPTHGGKGFSFSVEVNKDDDDNWDGTLEASMLTLSSEAVLGTVTVDNDTKTISGTYGVKGSATSPVTFYLLLPATDTQAAKRLDYDRSFTACEGSDGTSYNIRVRKTAAHVNNKYYWDNTDGWISSNTTSSIGSGKSGTVITVMDTDFDTIGSSNTQNVWVRTYHANIKKVRIYAQFRADNMTVNNVYKHSDFLSADSKYIVAYSAVYNGDADATGLGDADSFGYVDITLEEPMSANDVLLVKFSTDRVRPLGAVLTEGRSSGSLETSLVWSNSQSDGATLEKREDDVDFAVTANRGGTYLDNANASLGTISYSSSNTSVATVNAATGQVTIADNIDFGSADYKTTTITATLAASGCYKRCVLTYVLQVNKYVCTEAVGTVDIQTDNACSGKVLAVSGYEAGATIQWYKNGTAIPSATETTYTATTEGTYYAVTHKVCDAVSNEIAITFGAAAATKIVDSWYIKNDRRTPDIALVQTTNATGFTVTSSDDPVTSIGGCTFELKEDGIIYLHGTQDNGDAPSGMTPGDMTITITATACSNATPLDIVLHIQAETTKPSVAFVVDGTLRKDGGTATSVLEAKTSDRPLWKYLENTFTLTGCNAYWSVDSKELRQYYSQFDAILITDDPSTDTKGTGGVSYVKAFGTMVDVRPVLTMEAYVGKFKDGGWHVYDATPTSPNPRQVELKLECKNHDIFKGLNPATSDNVRTTTDEYGNEYWHVTMVDTTQSPYHNTKSDYEALPALQGFDRTKFSNMLGVGTIFEEKLQGGVERQEEPAARMMILGIQNNAMGALTNEGKLIVKNALEYLLKTNMEDVNDCANYFTNADGDGQWSNGANWTRGEVPDFETRARILQPVTIGNGTTAIAARVDIAASGESKHLGQSCKGSITIEPQGILKVGGKVTRAKAPYFGIDDLQPTENSDLVVKASTTAPHKQGALIFDNSDGDTHAVVEMWNPSYWEVDGGTGKKTKYWSYVAVPIQEADIPNFFWHGFTYLYDETSGWIKKGDGTSLYPFQGIGASLQEGNMETFYGPLATTESQDITLTYTAGIGKGMNLIGNSWTAPIQIANFEEDDFGDAAAEVWVFNTGNKNDGTPGSGSSATRGQWNTIPINSAGLPGYEGLKVIPAMQAFEVNTTSETTLHLDYDRLVRAGRENLNEPMRAPRRSAAKQIEATMRVRVSGESTHTDVYLLKDARFSDGFDNGWDGHFLSGDNRSARLYAISEEEGALAFMAQPEIEGTQLGFAPSKEGNEYTFSFSYDGDDEYYLNDLKLTTATLISAENSYLFTYEEGDTNRFYISRQPLGAPAVATGVDNTREELKPRKFIYNNKMYILYNGRVFDATGKVVK